MLERFGWRGGEATRNNTSNLNKEKEINTNSNSDSSLGTIGYNKRKATGSATEKHTRFVNKMKPRATTTKLRPPPLYEGKGKTNNLTMHKHDKLISAKTPDQAAQARVHDQGAACANKITHSTSTQKATENQLSDSKAPDKASTNTKLNSTQISPSSAAPLNNTESDSNTSPEAATQKPSKKLTLNSTQTVKSSAEASAKNSNPRQNVTSWALDVPRVDENNTNATGKDKQKLKKQNKQRRQKLQASQDPTSHWTTHQGKRRDPVFATGELPPKRGQMWPKNLAATHPAGELLRQYGTSGCPVNTGRNWTVAEMQSAIDKGPHSSALDPAAILQAKEELDDKVKSGQARVVLWDDIKNNPPEKLKISPFAMIPHKSRGFRGLLDLSFPVTMVDRDYLVDSVNAASSKTAPQGAIDQIGQVLPRIIAAIAESKPDEVVFMAKFDIKDGFWRLVCEEGEEYNFAYVLPQNNDQPTRLVIPTSLQMGWIESPGYFCAAAETGRDVASEYAESKVGSLPTHKFNKYTTTSEEFKKLPDTLPVGCYTLAVGQHFKYMLEVYVDDFLGIAIPRSKADLNHLSNALMHGIHDVFPASATGAEDPIAEKKLKKKDGEWAHIKELLGWTFNGEKKTMELSTEKAVALLGDLKAILRTKRAVRFKIFEKTMGKARNACIGIPAGRGMFSPINAILANRGKHLVYVRKNSPLWRSIQYLHTMIKEAQKEPTHCCELVTAEPNFVGICDAAKEGAGGVVFGETDKCVPTVFRLEWPVDVRREINTDSNKKGSLTNSDLEMAGLLLLWIVIEAVCPVLRHKHVAVFSDNTPTVSWVDRLASKQSKTAGGLLRALSFRMRHHRSSPLTALHIRGIHNSIADIPSRSFGGTPAWHCKTDTEFLTLFNKKFPLPQQNSWQLFRIAPALSMRVISILRTTDSEMDVWQRLPALGRSIGGTGKAMCGLYNWSLTYRQTVQASDQASEPSLGSQVASDKDSTVMDAQLQLQTALRLSQPLARRSRWTQDPIRRSQPAATSSTHN